MKPNSFVYLNLDTQLHGWDVEGTEWSPDKMGVSVAIALTQTRLHIFTVKNIAQLIPLLKSAKAVVGYNLEGFDFRVLSGSPGVDLSNVDYVDLLSIIEATVGGRVPLHDVARATLGCEQIVDGMDCVQLWKDGKVEQVIERVTSNALRMKALHEYGMEHGEIFFHPGESNRRERVAVDWGDDLAIKRFSRAA